MILFHRSDRIVMKPDVLHSRKEVDFGAGFYTTPIEDQARNWCRKFIRRGKHGWTFDNLISRSEAIGRLAMEKPNLQICFRRQEILDRYLKFERGLPI